MFDDLYEALRKKKARWENEEEVRLGWIAALQNALGIDFHAERGKKDSSYNNVVIEFKGPGKFRGKATSPAFREAVDERLKPYIVKTAKEEGREQPDYIGIAIDSDHLSFAQVANGVISHGPLLPFSQSSVAMVAMALKDAFRRAITADNLIADFGHTSDAGRELMKVLADAVGHHMQSAGNNKVKMLFEEWQSLFGQVADLSTEQSAAIRREISFTVEARAHLRIPLALFVIHTYNSLIIKLLAAEIISAHGLTSYKHFAQTLATSDDDALLDAVTTEIERGMFYSRAGIDGFVQEALFSWYLDACQDAKTRKAIVGALRAILVQLSLYRTDKLDNARSSDLLKRFYQDLVPDVLRKSLGEFYTPDWLVNFTLDKAGVKDWLKTRLLDPTCGSGSFLLVAIQRKRAAAEAAGLTEAKTVEMLTTTVWGFDLNPLAVLATRVNYLIAIADLLTPGQQLELPVLLADAIYSPARDPEDGEEIVNYRIGSTTADLKFSIPAALAFDRKRLDAVIESMADSVSQNCEWKDAARSLVRAKALTPTEEQEWRAPLEATYKRVLALHRKQWNGIWFRIVRNFFWSATAGRFDLVAGNPPWVRWSKLPELYRERVKPTCEQYDIFSKTPHHGGNELDISGMITYTVADKWLADNGKLVFVITQTHFQSPSSQGFRNFRINEEDMLLPLGVDDMKGLRPFPDAANKTAVAAFRKTKNKRPTYPVRYTVWRKRDGFTNNIPVTCDVRTVLARIEAVPMEANPVGGEGSPWAILPVGRFTKVEKIAGASQWVNGRKGITADLNGVYFVDVLDENPTAKLVKIATRPEAGKRNIGTSKEFWVEPELLYPLLKGASDFSACRLHRDHDLFVFIPNRGIRQDDYDNAMATMDRLKKTKAYFAAYERQLRARSTYKTRQTKAPYYAIYNVGDYSFSPWKVIWAEQGGFCAAVVGSSTVPLIGSRPFVPDHKIFFADFTDKAEAHYLCGLLNSELVKEFVESHNISIQVGDIFKHMRLPAYDKTNSEHRQLVAAVDKTHKASEADYERCLDAVRERGEAILARL